MTSPRILAILLVLVGVVTALKCYTGHYAENVKPSSNSECKGKSCTKVILKNDKSAYYGCDMTNMCNKDDCVTDKNGDTLCCCSKELCNSSSKLSALFIIAPLALITFFI
ncbi:hypothetical protein RB195_003869 [Necator americanus]|uniref:ET module n=1 Tax=Necator americanus TaxID=51031 RepID=A0ABR1DQM2_NECAM